MSNPNSAARPRGRAGTTSCTSEPLESRRLMAAAEVIARSGANGLLGINPEISINNNGRVAFIGQDTASASGSEGVWVGDGGGVAPHTISQGFSAPSRDFSFPQISDTDRVVARERVAGSPPNYLIRTWDATQTSSFTTIAFVFNGNPVTLPSISSNGFVTYVEAEVLGAPATRVKSGSGAVLASFSSTLALRPFATDGGTVVLRAGNAVTDPIVAYGGAPRTVASSAQFSALGQSPGASGDGSAVSFYGETNAAGAATLGAGAGIFVRTAAGVRRVAGVSGNGVLDPGETGDTNHNGRIDAGEHDVGPFASFSNVARVGVGGDGGQDLYFVYLATGTDNVSAAYRTTLKADGSVTHERLVAVGDTVGGVLVSQLQAYDPVNDKGQAAVWVGNSAGTASAALRYSAEEKITGRVVDADGNPLSGVKVTATVGATTTVVDQPVFTDYDSPTATTLDGNLNGDLPGDFKLTGDFSSKHSPITLTFNAADLNNLGVDSTYTQTAVVTAAQIASGSFDITVPIKFDKAGDAYKVIDSQGRIHLHKDLNPLSVATGQTVSTYSHEIKRRVSTDPLVADKRYKAEVKAVTAKLASLGFRTAGGGTLAVATEWGAGTTETPAERAAKLFQALAFVTDGYNNQVFDAALGVGNTGSLYTAHAAPGREKVTGMVNAETLGKLNAAAGVIWTKTLPPNLRLDPSANGWLTASASLALAAIGGTHTVTDAAHPDGGKYNGPHDTHSVGLGVDLRLMGHTGEIPADPVSGRDFYRPLYGHVAGSVTGFATQTPIKAEEYTTRTADVAALHAANPTWTPTKLQQEAEKKAYLAGKRWIVTDGYDRANTKALVTKLLALPDTRVVYFNDPSLGITNAKLQTQKGHQNHVHVGFNFVLTAFRPAGTDGAPIWPGNATATSTPVRVEDLLA